ncbi:MAG: hypothetical protein COA92_01605 [Sulfurovum sp.]|nr:MAG: hypothetical protein COA92_01605 [Sulfurovum sp.]
MVKLLLASILLLGMFSSFSIAHSGGTDRQGCHVDSRTGVRHCH